MSSITKLQIRGIRSYSPDRDEIIEFYTPLTMIIGKSVSEEEVVVEEKKLFCCCITELNRINFIQIQLY